MLEQMKSMITRRGRHYTFAFYRQMTSQAEDAVKQYHKMGYCAFKKKVLDSKGCPVWAIYNGGLKDWKGNLTEEHLQGRNMRMMLHHLIRAKEAFQRYKKHNGKEDFHFETVKWGVCYNLDRYYNFDESMEEAIYAVEIKME